MKKIIAIIICICILAFAGCSDGNPEKKTEESSTQNTSETNEAAALAVKDGELKSYGMIPDNYLSPEAEILTILSLDDIVPDVIFYNVPAEAQTINIRAYRFEENEWKNVFDSGTSIMDNSQRKGELVIKRNSDYSIRVTSDLFLATTKPLTLSEEIKNIRVIHLEDFWEFELDKEVPICMIGADGEKREFSYNLEDYPSTETLDGVGLAQVVTIEFSSEPI